MRLLSLLVVFAVWLLSGCGAPAGALCGPSTCAGCCNGDRCEQGTAVSACGMGGLTCSTCSAGASCNVGGQCSGGTGGAGGGTAQPSGDSEWSRWVSPPVAPMPSDYTVNGDTVIDSVTRLVWQHSAPVTTMTLSEARSYCTQLNLGGFANWRLPTLVELSSLVDYGVLQPAIEITAFPNTVKDAYWTGTRSSRDAAAAWTVDFNIGQTWDGYTETSKKSVRCVSAPLTPGGGGGAPIGRYAVSADTVKDNITGLVWQRTLAPDDIYGSSVHKYCDDLQLGGASDWRLPTVKELQTLLDVRAVGVKIDTNAFPSTPLRQFWSSSVYGTGALWTVDFHAGHTFQFNTGYALRARCVRSPQL